MAFHRDSGTAYPRGKEMEADRPYFIKKMGWSEEKFEAYMRRPQKRHDEYPSEAALYAKLLKLYRKLNLSVGRISWNKPNYLLNWAARNKVPWSWGKR